MTIPKFYGIIIIEKEIRETNPKKLFQKKSKKGIDKLKKVWYNTSTKKQGRQELPKLIKKGCDQTQERGLS